jgi:hypothetical protein
MYKTSIVLFDKETSKIVGFFGGKDVTLYKNPYENKIDHV